MPLGLHINFYLAFLTEICTPHNHEILAGGGGEAQLDCVSD